MAVKLMAALLLQMMQNLLRSGLLAWLLYGCLHAAGRLVDAEEDTAVEVNSEFRGNLAFKKPVAVGSNNIQYDASQITDGQPDWTALAKLKPGRGRSQLRSSYVGRSAAVGCVELQAATSTGFAWAAIDLGARQPVGFVRVYDALDPQMSADVAQRVVIVLSEDLQTNPDDFLAQPQQQQQQQQQTSPSGIYACGGWGASWNISAWDQPIDVPCFGSGRFATVMSTVPGRALRLCSVEVYEVNHQPSKACTVHQPLLGWLLHAFSVLEHSVGVNDRVVVVLLASPRLAVIA